MLGAALPWALEIQGCTTPSTYPQVTDLPDVAPVALAVM
jgi:hypothetical protein